MIKVNKTKDWVFFEMNSIEPVSEREAMLQQQCNGYIPMGYGFYAFKCEKKTDTSGKEFFAAKWRCSASCD